MMFFSLFSSTQSSFSCPCFLHTFNRRTPKKKDTQWGAKKKVKWEWNWIVSKQQHSGHQVWGPFPLPSGPHRLSGYWPAIGKGSAGPHGSLVKQIGNIFSTSSGKKLSGNSIRFWWGGTRKVTFLFSFCWVPPLSKGKFLREAAAAQCIDGCVCVFLLPSVTG